MTHRTSLLASLAALTIAATALPALADSRIFTAHSNQDGVTIEQAFRNGDELDIVGRGDDSTLFRIDSPSTPVGCANRIEFVTSTGERIDLVSDMCELNWEVTVKVQPAEVAATPTAPEVPAVPAVPEVPAAPGSEEETVAPIDGASLSQVVSVAVDDPALTIIAVRLDGKPVNIIGRKGGAVQFEITGTDEGIACDRELGVIFSNGKQVTRQTNICLNDWSIMVATGAETPPAPPVAELPPMAPTEEMVWIFSTFENGASLGHGIPETDASDFGAVCTPRSGRILITLLDAGVPGLTPGSPVPISISGGGFARTYAGVGSPFDELAGASLPQVEVSAKDELWDAIVREKALNVAAGPSPFVLSLQGSAGPAREFLAMCSDAPVAAPQPPRPGPAIGPGIVANYYCADGSAFAVTYNGPQQIATLAQAGAPPLTLRWDPNGPIPRYTAGPARLVLRDDSEVRWSRFGGPALSCRQR